MRNLTFWFCMMGETSNILLSSWVVFGLLLETAFTTSISVTPSSKRLLSGTELHLSCNYDHPQNTMFFSFDTEARPVYSPLTVDPSMTGKLSCTSYLIHSPPGCNTDSTCMSGGFVTSSYHAIVVVPKAPTIRLYSPSPNPGNGEDITLSCEAERWTPINTDTGISYKFMKNSAEIYSGTEQTYTFTLTESSSSYSCIVLAGAVGSALSPSKYISSTQLSSTVAPLVPVNSVNSVNPSLKPEFYTTSAKPDLGDDITLICENPYTCSTTITYTFMKNSAVLYSGTNKVYAFTVTESSSGSYSCNVIKAGTATSPQSLPSVVSVRLPSSKPPTLYTTSSKPNIGDDMTLICDYASTSSVTVTYTFMINSTTVYSGTDKTYKLTVTAQSTGSYSCKVHYGTVTSASSSHATVTVGRPSVGFPATGSFSPGGSSSGGLQSTGQFLGSHTPVLYSSASNPHVGDVITLICDYVLIESVTITYEFMMGSTVLHSGANKTFTFTVTAQSTGSYSCGVNAGAVSSPHSSPSNVAVSRPVSTLPSLYSSSRYPSIGEEITLICDYTWTGSVTMSYDFMINSAKVHSGANKTFTFTVTEQSTGSYSCIVHAGTITSSPSHPVHVAVRPPVTTAMPTVPTTTTQSPIPFPCETGPNAVFDYSYGYDPAKYIHCEADGKAYIKTCPYGKLWNQAVRKCETPSPQVG